MNITVHYGFCEEHYEPRHLIDERGHHVANSRQELESRGFFYLRHVGGCHFEYRAPAQVIDAAPEWVLAHDTKLFDFEPDF